MTLEVLVPTFDGSHVVFEEARRLDSLAETTVGIISNGKHGTTPFFDALEAELRTSYGVADVVRVTKPNYSAPAGDDLLAEAKHWHALVAGIGD